MQPKTDTDYKSLFTQLIKKQMLVLGPDITLAKVKNVIGLTVDLNGDVLKIDGDPQQMLQTLINQFVELSGMIVKKTMESILTSYPGMIAMASSTAFGGAQAVTQAVTPTVSTQTTSTDSNSDAVEVSKPTSENQQSSSGNENPAVEDTSAKSDAEPASTSQSSLGGPASSESSAEPQEPPPMTSMHLDSLSTDVKKQNQPSTEPQAFTSKEMEDLNKALDQLSKAPLSTENPPSQTG